MLLSTFSRGLSRTSLVLERAMMAKAMDFPNDVMREIDAAANARDRITRVAHLELAIFYLQTSREAPADSRQNRTRVEAAVLSQLVFPDPAKRH